MSQIQNSFDKETVTKILKGFCYSFLGGLSAAITSYLQSNDAKTAILVGISAMIVPATANAGVQYRSGEPE